MKRLLEDLDLVIVQIAQYTTQRHDTIPTTSISSSNRSTSAASSPSCAAPFPPGRFRRVPEESTMKKICSSSAALIAFGAVRRRAAAARGSAPAAPPAWWRSPPKIRRTRSIRLGPARDQRQRLSSRREPVRAGRRQVSEVRPAPADALYWRAWALYHIGLDRHSKSDLDDALAAIDRLQKDVRQERRRPPQTPRRSARRSGRPRPTSATRVRRRTSPRRPRG